MKLEELVEKVNDELTFSGLVPKVLPDLEIRRLILDDATLYFSEYPPYKDLPKEELYEKKWFRAYLTGLTKMKLGEVIGRLSFSLPGNVNYNPMELINMGRDILSEVRDQMNKYE